MPYFLYTVVPLKQVVMDAQPFNVQVFTLPKQYNEEINYKVEQTITCD